MSVIIVLSDCPPKLRGDMSKWFFEINTGIYVGNVSARVREKLWERITTNIGHGHATMVYSAPGEQRMCFLVHNSYWKPVDFDGITLMCRPDHRNRPSEVDKKETGFSNAAKRQYAQIKAKKGHELDGFCASSYVVLDFETTGLDAQKDSIIEVGAILVDRGKIAEKMETLVHCQRNIPPEITQLTGIKNEHLEKEGISLDDAICRLWDLSEEFPFVCYHAPFEKAFLTEACSKTAQRFDNRFIDVLQFAKLLLPEIGNYQLAALANYFGIVQTSRHRALADCVLTQEVYVKLKEIAFS